MPNSIFYRTTLEQMKNRFNIPQARIDHYMIKKDGLFFTQKIASFADYFISMINIDKNIDFNPNNNNADKILYFKMKIIYFLDINSRFINRNVNLSNTTPILKFFRDNVQSKLENKSASARKYYYLSGHDSTIIDVLSAVRYNDPQCLINFVASYTEKDEYK